MPPTQHCSLCGVEIAVDSPRGLCRQCAAPPRLSESNPPTPSNRTKRASLTSGTNFGPYQIRAAIGAGGMGEVYRAVDTRLGRKVGIKLLPAAFTEHTERRRRFEQEARSASALNRCWERKGRAAAQKIDPNLADLFAANGYDGALGKMEQASHLHIAGTIQQRFGLNQNHRLLEVGCGAGAILLLLRDSGASLSGVDYSASLLEVARRILPSAEFQEAEASALPFPDASFDRILSSRLRQRTVPLQCAVGGMSLLN